MIRCGSSPHAPGDSRCTTRIHPARPAIVFGWGWWCVRRALQKKYKPLWGPKKMNSIIKSKKQTFTPAAQVETVPTTLPRATSKLICRTFGQSESLLSRGDLAALLGNTINQVREWHLTCRIQPAGRDAKGNALFSWRTFQTVLRVTISQDLVERFAAVKRHSRPRVLKYSK